MTENDRKYFKGVLERDGLDKAEATVSHLPRHTRDGYEFGGGAVITIGDRSIFIGESINHTALAVELADRWNSK